MDTDMLRSLFTVVDTFVMAMLLILTLNYFFPVVMLVITVSLSLWAYSINRKFNRVSSQLLSFTTKSRAELLDIYLELFENITMLRSSGKRELYTEKFYDSNDAFQTAYTNLYNHSMRWLNVRISLFSMCLIISITSLPLLTKLFAPNFYQ